MFMFKDKETGRILTIYELESRGDGLYNEVVISADGIVRLIQDYGVMGTSYDDLVEVGYEQITLPTTIRIDVCLDNVQPGKSFYNVIGGEYDSVGDVSYKFIDDKNEIQTVPEKYTS